ncbi:MAG: hypothetical protein ACI8UO_005771 [Verrucomicrobiales bacterium]|jgi:hypothetical protein
MARCCEPAARFLVTRIGLAKRLAKFQSRDERRLSSAAAGRLGLARRWRGSRGGGLPLAKQNVEDDSVVDVYELIINGQEISPGYSELNDSVVQRAPLEE